MEAIAVVAPLRLPDPSLTRLRRCPIQLVVCQVRHDRNLAVTDGTRILAISDQLGEYPKIEEAAQQEIGVVFAPGGPSPVGGTEQKGWRLRSEDGVWTVTLLPDFFALECTVYTDWENFRQRLHDLADAVSTHLKPAMELRLGLRYVDRIEVPSVTEPRDWQGLINENLLGPIKDAQLGPSLQAIQQLLQLQAQDDIQALLRHGTQRDESSGTWPYLLDTDCFRTGSRQLNADSLISGADELHLLALQLFQASITPQLMGILVGEEDA
jgi:uncharacterized protein (TIGR04255 family)